MEFQKYQIWNWHGRSYKNVYNFALLRPRRSSKQPFRYTHSDIFIIGFKVRGLCLYSSPNFHSKAFLRTNTSSQTYTRCGMNACPSNVCNLCSLSGSILNIQQLSRRVLQDQISFKSVFKDIYFKSNLHKVWHECLSVKFCTFDSKA